MSEDLIKDLYSAGFGLDKIRLIMNGISFADSPNSIQTAYVRATLGISDDCFVIGCVASLIPVKAHADLLNAIARVVKVIPGSLVLLVGDGPLRSELELMVQDLGIKDAVKFLGYRSDARELYAAFDVFALVSHSEGLPMAMLEAMAVGLPVVVSAVGAIPTVITPMKNGLLITPGDIDGISNVLIQLGTQQELRKTLGQSARGVVTAYYSVQRMARDYEKVYQEVLELCP